MVGSYWILALLITTVNEVYSAGERTGKRRFSFNVFNVFLVLMFSS